MLTYWQKNTETNSAVFELFTAVWNRNNVKINFRLVEILICFELGSKINLFKLFTNI